MFSFTLLLAGAAASDPVISLPTCGSMQPNWLVDPRRDSNPRRWFQETGARWSELRGQCVRRLGIEPGPRIKSPVLSHSAASPRGAGRCENHRGVPHHRVLLTSVVGDAVHGRNGRVDEQRVNRPAPARRVRRRLNLSGGRHRRSPGGSWGRCPLARGQRHGHAATPAFSFI